MILTSLIKTIKEKGAAHILLIDPDKRYEESLEERVKIANDSGVDALLVGGSLMMDAGCEKRVKKIKSISKIPVIGEILVGKKVGEGVFGISFKIKGLPNNTKTTVNPVKTLTPRFITRTLEKLKKN